MADELVRSPQSACHHYWLIGSNDAGVCKLCGASRKFHTHRDGDWRNEYVDVNASIFGKRARGERPAELHDWWDRFRHATEIAPPIYTRDTRTRFHERW